MLCKVAYNILLSERRLLELHDSRKVIIEPSVDAKVTPTWTNEDDLSLMQSQCLTHSKKMSRFENLKRNQGMEVDMNEQTSSYDIPDIFKRRKNDLQVYVEPLKTSGSLCLTVIG